MTDGYVFPPILENPFTSPVKKLNVGGQTFEISRTTIQKLPELAREWQKLQMDSRGVPFLDQDPDVFSLALKYIRNPHIVIPGTCYDEFENLCHLLGLSDADLPGRSMPSSEQKMLVDPRTTGKMEFEATPDALLSCYFHWYCPGAACSTHLKVSREKDTWFEARYGDLLAPGKHYEVPIFELSPEGLTVEWAGKIQSCSGVHKLEFMWVARAAAKTMENGEKTIEEENLLSEGEQ